LAERHAGFSYQRALPGPSFGEHSSARRPRIGGACGPNADSFLVGLEAAFGPNSTLVPRASLAVDADACHIDEHAIVTAADWWAVILQEKLDRVTGSFALAWAAEDGSLSLARDAIGHRSLYYAHDENSFVFASTVRALLEVGAAPRRIDLRALAAYLAYAYVPGRSTLALGISEVLPGEIVSFRLSALKLRQFWDLPSEPRRFEAEEALRTGLRATLARTVEKHLPANAAVAASLSGGIDSSLVVALAQRVSPFEVASYSITFGPDYADEIEWSSLCAKHCRTSHTIVEITPSAVLAHLDDTVAALDKPNGDPLTVPNALLFRAMAERSSVALNGEGGDPCFGGPKNLPMLLSALYGHGDEPSAGANQEDLGAPARNYLRAHLKCFDELPDLLCAEIFRAACTPALESDVLPWFSDSRWGGLVSKLMAINTRFKGGHHILPKVNALSAPFGVFARSPLFDKALVEFAFSIPPELKLRGTDEKYLLKQAVRDLLPAAILERPKSGMLVPVEAWFQGPLLPQAKARILDGLGSTIFRRSYLEKLLQGKLGGLRPRRGVKIWLLLTLEAHLRTLGLSLS